MTWFLHIWLKVYTHIPTYEDGKWTYTDFIDRKDFYDFVKSIFKEPGLYTFDKTSKSLYLNFYLLSNKY